VALPTAPTATISASSEHASIKPKRFAFFIETNVFINGYISSTPLNSIVPNASQANENKSRISATLSGEKLEQLEPDNAQYAGGYAYDNINRMYHRESENLSKKRNRQDEAQKDNRAAGYPPESGIGSPVDLADSAGPGTVGHHKAEVGDYQSRECQGAGIKFPLPTGKAEAKYGQQHCQNTQPLKSAQQQDARAEQRFLWIAGRPVHHIRLSRLNLIDDGAGRVYYQVEEGYMDRHE
jgi:hypothetical protein